MDQRMEKQRDWRRKAVIRYAQDKVLTKSHVACKAGTGRRNLSSVPHLSIDIPVSPSPTSGFCNYHQTGASRPPKHWLTARINRDVERPFDAVCLFIYAALLSMCSMFLVSDIDVCLCLFLPISWFEVHIYACTVLMCSATVAVKDRKDTRMECCISIKKECE